MKMILTHYYHDENPDMRRFTLLPSLVLVALTLN